MAATPDARVSMLSGGAFGFQDGGHDIRFTFSGTGKQTITVDGRVVVKARGLLIEATEHVFVVEGVTYGLRLQSRNRFQTRLACSLTREGVLVGTHDARFALDAWLHWRSLGPLMAVAATVGITMGLAGSLLNLPPVVLAATGPAIGAGLIVGQLTKGVGQWKFEYRRGQGSPLPSAT